MFERRYSPRERRRTARAPLVAAVKQRVGGEVQLALSQDVGPSGIKLKRVSGRWYLPSTPVSMVFELPDGGGLLRVHGEVVSERAEGAYQSTHVRFEDLSPLDHARILRFIHRSSR